jgi:predicted HTH transcriptional regulator
MDEKELYGETETIEFKPTASRELAELVDLNLLEQHGITGKGTFYELRQGA